ncbi:MAG: aminomethyl-transferring glycine dehydrogenase subunit GcvPB [bacterium]|nr:aminomethyl-transferring glycine dehydrogenase subunit GcvPB [bacterium]
MKLVFDISKPGRSSQILPECDVPEVMPDAAFLRQSAPALPEIPEVEVDRHYNELAQEVFGVCDGFYPLGSCTMKYSPKVNETIAALPGFAKIHPLQPAESAQGALQVMSELSSALAEITGMDAVSLQPAAGAHGEYTGLLLIREYHLSRGDTARTKIIVPDSAHGTNPASSVMAGFEVVNVVSNAEGGVDLDGLREAVGPDTAGLMLTNPNTLGLFDPNITEICKIIHEAGGLCYYDGANLNPIMGVMRPGDMGFDCVHVNLHKTFSTPHGGGGPGAGPVGCKELLAKFLPTPVVIDSEGRFELSRPESSLGRMKAFYGNFSVMVKALAYIKVLGAEGIAETAKASALNANYMMRKLDDLYFMPYGQAPCMHEFVMDIAPLEHETGCSAMDVAKRLLDFGMHAPTMYFPLIVHEALMVEPTETESRENLDRAIEVLRQIWQECHDDPEFVKASPHDAAIGRPDEVTAARHPVVRWIPEA